MKRETFLQPKEEQRPNPNNTPTVIMDLKLNQMVLANGSLYVVQEITHNISLGTQELVIRAVAPGSVHDFVRVIANPVWS